jgi:hypothetical protein
MIKKFMLALVIVLAAFGIEAREIIERGVYKLYLNGVEKGKETYKIAVDKKKDTYELFSELTFKYPYQAAKRGYVDLRVYPQYEAVLSTGEFLNYDYRSKAEDFSKTDLVETEKSATELIDQEYRIINVFDQEAQRTDNIMQDRIDLGVNSGYLYPAGKVLRFSQTRYSSTKKKDEALPPNMIILEPYGYCLYRLLLDKIKGDGPRWDFILAIPQFMRLRSAAVEYEGTISTYVSGSTYILKHYNVLIEDKLYSSFWVDKDGVIVQVSVPTEGVVAVISEYGPKTFEKEQLRVSKENLEISGAKFNEKQIHIECKSGTIGATLTLPDGEGPFPSLLMVQDFQPVDRDGNTVQEAVRKVNPWKQLAFAFAEKGIATLRFDSRGVSESAGDPALLTLDGRITEIKALLAYLRSEPKLNKERLFIMSQGLGSWSVMKTLNSEKPAGVIFTAFPMKAILRIWKEQVSLMQNLEGQQTAYAELEALESEIKKDGKDWETFRGVRLNIPVIRELSLFDPAEELKGLSVRAMFAYPEKDEMILPFHGEILDKESAGKYKPVYLKGLGHSFTDVDEEGNQKALVNKAALAPLYDFILK